MHTVRNTENTEDIKVAKEKKYLETKITNIGIS